MDSSPEADSRTPAPPSGTPHAHTLQSASGNVAGPVQPARLLSLSTSGAWCSVALYRHGFGDDESDCISEPLGAQQSMNILAMIDELCRGARIELTELDAIVFDAGPGSFTGLRVACAVAQGLGFALGLPLIAVDSLRALAWQRVRFGAEAAIVLAARDARMNELYVALYRAVALPGMAGAIAGCARLETLEAPHIVARDRFVDEIDGWLRANDAAGDTANFLRAGDAWVHAPTALAWDARFGTHMPPAPMADDAWVRADALAELGCADWYKGCAVVAADAAPRYLRDKVALDVDEQRAARQRARARSAE